ncbi:MAG: RICIN domain-containing protein [Firmicutes bacterium]|nr:RICIN domain-containing protein [Bacillota bacterium]
MKRKIYTLLLALTMVLAVAVPALNAGADVYATCSSGIKGNGTGGININVNGSIYTNSGWGNTNGAPYGTGGCTWFAGARVMELTGKGSYVCYGPTKWLDYGKSLGFQTGTAYPTGRAVIVYSGHVAILEKTEGDTAYISEGGSTYYSDAAHGYTVIRTMAKSAVANGGFVGSGSFLGFVYLGNQYGPDADLPSDFYGSITLAAGKSVSVNASNNYNVEIMSVPDSDAEKVKSDAYKSRYWHYVKNSDGSYRITNCLYEGRPLEAAGTASGNNVKVGTSYTGAAKQKWFIYGRWSGEYIFRSAASDFVLNVDSAKSDPGTNLQIWKFTNSAAEKMAIYKTGTTGKATLSVKASTEDKDTVFSWSKPEGEVAWYNIWIHKLDSSGNVTAYYDQKNMWFDSSQTSYTKSVKLPAGKYTAKIVPHSWANYYVGDAVSFTVSEAAAACTHSNTELRGKVSATCTAAGYTGDKYCKDCGELITKGSAVPAKGHAWSSEYTIDKEPTCTADGSKSRHCENCDEVSDVTVIPAAGHSFGEWETIDAGSCEGAGAQQHTCTVCGFTESKSLNPEGHAWESEFTVDTPATCTMDGSRSIHCKNCGAIKESEIIPATGHTYSEWYVDTEATCTNTGSKSRKCEVCGDEVTEIIPAQGHTWSTEYAVDKEATCKETGTKSIHCILCDEVKPGSAAVIEKGEHDYGNWAATAVATCTKTGSQTRTCKICGDELTETIPALGHEWNGGEIIEKPTCTEEGVSKFTCRECGDTKEELTPPLGHNWDESFTTDRQPTCSEEGQKSIHCTRCDRIKAGSETPIEKKPHTLTAEKKIQKATPASDGRIYQICSVCENEVTVEKLSKVKIMLEATSFTYTGKAITPEIAVISGNKPVGEECYTVTWSGNTKIGTATAKITFDSEYYEGSKNLTFQINKAANPLSVKGKTAAVKFSKVKKKAQTLSAAKVITFTKKAQGKVTYAKTSGNKKITINKKTGKVTVKKGIKKGTYKVKLQITAAGTDVYSSAIKTVTIKIKVK